MNSRRLLLIAGAVFAVSFFLPAFGTLNGFECLRFCWEAAFDKSDPGVFFNCYYPAFVLTNAFFVAILASGLARSRFFRTRCALAAVAFLHVASWLVLNLADPENSGVKIGYFVWLLAYVLLLASQISETQKSSAA